MTASKFTGFIVERKDTPGLSLGNEEHKMGIKGSSTRQVFLTDALVPKENVLGEIGKGHLIAFNVLNIGRIKLAAACLGACKQAATLSVRYANERVQFKLPISQVRRHSLQAGAAGHSDVRRRIGHLPRRRRTFTAPSSSCKAEGKGYNEALLGAAREFAVECAMLKVEGSEVLDYVVDEGVQIYGGYGFSADYPMDRSYRDARINRIFEGTNEINRMLAVDMILKKGLKGRNRPDGPRPGRAAGADEHPQHGRKRRLGLRRREKSHRRPQEGHPDGGRHGRAEVHRYSLAKEQEVLMNIADMAIKTYVAESTLLRVEKEIASLKGEATLSRELDMARVYLSDTIDQVEKAGKRSHCQHERGRRAAPAQHGPQALHQARPIQREGCPSPGSRRAHRGQRVRLLNRGLVGFSRISTDFVGGEKHKGGSSIGEPPLCFSFNVLGRLQNSGNRRKIRPIRDLLQLHRIELQGGGFFVGPAHTEEGLRAEPAGKIFHVGELGLVGGHVEFEALGRAEHPGGGLDAP